MNVEELKRNLNYTKKKHQNDKVFTGDTNIRLMCEDCLNTIADMEAEIAQLKEENCQLKMKICQSAPSFQAVYKLQEAVNEIFNHDAGGEQHEEN